MTRFHGRSFPQFQLGRSLTREQAVALEKKRLAERHRQMRQARELAAQGRGEDTEVAHVALGEIVLPKALQTSDVLNAIRQAAQNANIPFNQLRIGSASNSINPETGMPEFGLLSGIGDWFSKTFGAGTANAAPDSTSPRPRQPLQTTVERLIKRRWKKSW